MDPLLTMSINRNDLLHIYYYYYFFYFYNLKPYIHLYLQYLGQLLLHAGRQDFLQFAQCRVTFHKF